MVFGRLTLRVTVTFMAELTDFLRENYSDEQLLVGVAADAKLIKLGVNDAVSSMGTYVAFKTYEYELAFSVLRFYDGNAVYRVGTIETVN